MSKYLITQSLLSAWQYQYQAYDSELAQDGFLRVLRREKTKTTKAMQAGIDFENAVTEYLSGVGGDGAVKTIGDIIKGAQLQVAVSTEKRIGGNDFVLYGKLDALKAGVIYDIKHSGSYEVGKYLNSPQHSMYLEIVPQAKVFQYLVSDGEEVFIETYKREETPPIAQMIQEFMRYLNDFHLKEEYFDKWKSS